MMRDLRHHEVLVSKISASDYTTLASSAENVDYCHFCLTRSLRASTCPALSSSTQRLSIIIINQRHTNLTKLPPGNSYQPANRGPRISGKSLTTYFRLRNRSPKRNGGTNLDPSLQEAPVPGTGAEPHVRRKHLLLLRQPELHH